MTNPRRKIRIVPLIPYPKEYKDRLKQLGPKVVDSIKKNGVDVSKGRFPLEDVNKPLDEALFYLQWISNSNEVLEALGLILADIRDLPALFHLQQGSPKARYYLLVRTFFHEFYRLREIFSATVREAAKRGYIEKEQVPMLRNAFHSLFEPVVELRNAVVHAHVTWTGQEHYDLELVVGAWEMRKRVVRKDTGEELTVHATLDKVCTNAVVHLGQQAKNVSKMIQAFVKDFVAITNEA